MEIFVPILQNNFLGHTFRRHSKSYTTAPLRPFVRPHAKLLRKMLKIAFFKGLPEMCDGGPSV